MPQFKAVSFSDKYFYFFFFCLAWKLNVRMSTASECNECAIYAVFASPTEILGGRP